MKSIKIQGFTLLEMILAMSILSILVYTVFIVFDRTMKALDSVFVGAHRYEQMQKFFNKICKELTSAQIGATEHGSGVGEVYDFMGGPHWIEFGTIVVEKMSIEEYIQKGVNALIAVPRKVHYYGSRRYNFNNLTGNPPPPTMFENHVFRLIPTDNLQSNFTWQPSGDINNPGTPYQYTTMRPIPYWLEDYRNQELINYSLDGLVPDHLYSVKEMMVCRAIHFEYYYDVVEGIDTNGNKIITRYCQDWWDSRIRYPSFTTDMVNPTESDYYNHFYDNLSDYQIATIDERDHRYNEYSSGSGSFTSSELWLYQNAPISFRAFDNNNISTSSYPRLFSGTPITDEAGTPLDPANPAHYTLVNADPTEDDPWFNKPPAMIKISVYMLNPTKSLNYNASTTTVVWYSKSSPSTPATEAELEEAYRGELFTMMLYMRNHSPSIASYKRDLIQE
ncbi:MAG: prepilin-type N-terminal cleavage/methylation domain-containing protein [Candidatus Aureabacteria bacterium]|nr:prepilin-type N-terminal cleavage/methylation domain-containing protein [Candidatus Auribacterota bacterium]